MVVRALPTYDVGSIVLSRMLSIFSRVQGICRTEEVNYSDL